MWEMLVSLQLHNWYKQSFSYHDVILSEVDCGNEENFLHNPKEKHTQDKEGTFE